MLRGHVGDAKTFRQDACRINAPEVAILGISRSAHKPVWDGKAFAPRLILPLSLSYDHRVIDGAQAARFITYFSGVLADFRRVSL